MKIWKTNSKFLTDLISNNYTKYIQVITKRFDCILPSGCTPVNSKQKNLYTFVCRPIISIRLEVLAFGCKPTSCPDMA